MHICVVKLTITGSDNGLLPGRRQAIWTNAGILLIGPLGINFIENLIGIQTFSFKKIHLKMSSAKWRPFCLGLNALNWVCYTRLLALTLTRCWAVIERQGQCSWFPTCILYMSVISHILHMVSAISDMHVCYSIHHIQASTKLLPFCRKNISK